MSEALVKKIKEIRRGLGNNEYRSEKDVCFSIVVPVLKKLGWKRIRYEHPVGKDKKERADIALFLPKHDEPSILLEVKKVNKVEEAVKQLYEYCYWEREHIKFGVTTDGASWRFHLPLEENKDPEVRRIDLAPDSDDSIEDIKQCLTRYLSIIRVKRGAALRAAKEDYQKKIQVDALRKEIPEILSDVIINNPRPKILNILVGECRKRIGSSAPSRKVIEEVLKGREKIILTRKTNRSNGKKPEPVKTGRYRTVVVGEWQDTFHNITRAQKAFLNALVREFGIKILRELAPLPSYKGKMIQRLAPTRDKIDPRKGHAWKNSTQLECGWYFHWGTNNLEKDKMAAKAIDVAHQMNPDLRVEWRPTDGEVQPGNGGKIVKPPGKGRAKVRIMIGDTPNDYATGAGALVALFKAVWGTFGQEVFEELLEQEAQKRGRPWLARSKKKFELTKKYENQAKEVAPGWWINTNLKQDHKTRFANKLIAIISNTHPQVPVKWIELK